MLGGVDDEIGVRAYVGHRLALGADGGGEAVPLIVWVRPSRLAEAALQGFVRRLEEDDGDVQARLPPQARDLPVELFEEVALAYVYDERGALDVGLVLVAVVVVLVGADEAREGGQQR